MRMEPDLGGAQDMGQGLLTSKKGLIVRIGRQIAVRLDQYVAGDQVERSQVARYRVESDVFRHMGRRPDRRIDRSEEHTSELQSLIRISYAVFCLKKKKKNTNKTQTKIR